MEALDGHRQTQPSACLHPEVSGGTLAPVWQEQNFLIHSCRKGCLWSKQKWTPSSLHTCWLLQRTLLKKKDVGAVEQKGLIPTKTALTSTHSLLKTSLKSELHDDISQVRWLCSVTPLTVTSISHQYTTGWTKALSNLLNSRAKAIPTLCFRLLLLPLVIQMTMNVLPPSSHPKPTQSSYSLCMTAYTEHAG